MDTIQSVSKAIAGAAVTALVAYGIKHGVVLTSATSDALTVVVTALIGFVVVYASPKNK